MRSKLQYVYSISVFLGVLVSSYLMMSQDGSPRVPVALQAQVERVEAGTVDPAVQSLFDIETALKVLPGQKASQQGRKPSFSKPVAE